MQLKGKLALMLYTIFLLVLVIYGAAFSFFLQADTQKRIEATETQLITDLQSNAVADAILLAKQASDITATKVNYYNSTELFDQINALESSYSAGSIKYFDTDINRVSLGFTIPSNLFLESTLLPKDIVNDVSQGHIRVEEFDVAITVYHPVLYDDEVIAGLKLTLSSIPARQNVTLAVGSSFSSWASGSLNVFQIMTILLVILVLPTFVLVHKWLINRFLLAPIKTLSDSIDLDGMAIIPVTLQARKDEVGSTARKIAELTATLDDRRRKADHLAYHDDLTGLPNLAFYREKIYEFCARYAVNGGKFAIIDINVRNMKAINQLVGHINGDVLLMQLASRLKDLVDGTKFGNEAFICRGHGDQFDVITPVSDINELKILGEHLQQGLSKSFTIEGNAISTSFTVAGVMYPDHGDNYESLKKTGELVLTIAKAKSSHEFLIYTDDIAQMAKREMDVTAALEACIAEGGIEMFYQPVIDMKTLEIRGAEALVRWNHPTLGFISPEEFIPIAERNNLILPLSYLITDRVCEQRFKWIHTVPDNFTVAINISPIQLTSPIFYKKIIESVYQHHLKPKHIELEITETAFLASDDEVFECLQYLKAEGFTIWLDDFGTGFSSLSHLQNYPVHGIKVDRSFVMDIENQGTNITLVSAIVELGIKLGKRVVAEGIENNMQSIILQRLGAHYAQGYFFGKPMNAKDFEAQFLIHTPEQQNGS